MRSPTTPTRYSVHRSLKLAVSIDLLVIDSVPFVLPTHVVPGGDRPIPSSSACSKICSAISMIVYTGGRSAAPKPAQARSDLVLVTGSLCRTNRRGSQTSPLR